MKIESVHIHNFRSIVDQKIVLEDYSLLVGANNAGKSTVINALRAFFGNLKVDISDRHCGINEGDIWVECVYQLTSSELIQFVKNPALIGDRLVIRKKLFPLDKKVNAVGKLIYIPASSSAEDHLKLSGPSDFRELLHDLIGSASKADSNYNAIGEALTVFSDASSKDGGMLHRIIEPLNQALNSWQVKVGMKVRPLTVEEICKLLISFTFTDENVEGAVDLNKFGNGLQRTVIYEMIRLISRLESESLNAASEYKLILFEEPENFLHPHQQEILAFSLRQLGLLPNQQVLITTHSPIFPGRAKDDLRCIIRLTKKKAVTHIYQLEESGYQDLLSEGSGLIKRLEEFVNDPKVDESKKKMARKLVANLPKDELLAQEEEFRYQLALDGERCAMFFAEHVIVVEGATEKALLEALLRDYWTDIQNRRLYVLDVMGKYNYHRFMSLFHYIGMSHSILIDDDNGNNEHEVINEFIESCSNGFTFGKIKKIAGNIELFLGLPEPKNDKKHRKPLEMLKALDEGRITAEKIAKLKEIFERDLLPPI